MRAEKQSESGFSAFCLATILPRVFTLAQFIIFILWPQYPFNYRATTSPKKLLMQINRYRISTLLLALALVSYASGYYIGKPTVAAVIVAVSHIDAFILTFIAVSNISGIMRKQKTDKIVYIAYLLAVFAYAFMEIKIAKRFEDYKQTINAYSILRMACGLGSFVLIILNLFSRNTYKQK